VHCGAGIEVAEVQVHSTEVFEVQVEVQTTIWALQSLALVAQCNRASLK
jgi:hypothetical protein